MKKIIMIIGIVVVFSTNCLAQAKLLAKAIEDRQLVKISLSNDQTELQTNPDDAYTMCRDLKDSILANLTRAGYKARLGFLVSESKGNYVLNQEVSVKNDRFVLADPKYHQDIFSVTTPKGNSYIAIIEREKNSQLLSIKSFRDLETDWQVTYKKVFGSDFVSPFQKSTTSQKKSNPVLQVKNDTSLRYYHLLADFDSLLDSYVIIIEHFNSQFSKYQNEGTDPPVNSMIQYAKLLDSSLRSINIILANKAHLTDKDLTWFSLPEHSGVLNDIKKRTISIAEADSLITLNNIAIQQVSLFIGNPDDVKKFWYGVLSFQKSWKSFQARAYAIESALLLNVETHKPDSTKFLAKKIDDWIEKNVLPQERFLWNGGIDLDHVPDKLKFTSIQKMEEWAVATARDFVKNNPHETFTLHGIWGDVTFKIWYPTFPKTVIDENGKDAQNFDLEITWDINMGEYQISRDRMNICPYDYHYEWGPGLDYSLERKNFSTHINEHASVSTTTISDYAIQGNIKSFDLFFAK
jgi:hypothetical protein